MGNWKIRHNVNGIFIIKESHPDDEKINHIARIAEVNTLNDAQLIVVAPEMLKAIKGIYEQWLSHGCTDNHCRLCKIYDDFKIKELIEKTTLKKDVL